MEYFRLVGAVVDSLKLDSGGPPCLFEGSKSLFSSKEFRHLKSEEPQEEERRKGKASHLQPPLFEKGGKRDRSSSMTSEELRKKWWLFAFADWQQVGVD